MSPCAVALPGALGRLRQPALAEERDRLFHVAVRFGQRGLALHHARAGLVAKLLHLICRDCCHCESLVSASYEWQSGRAREGAGPSLDEPSAGGAPARDVGPAARRRRRVASRRCGRAARVSRAAASAAAASSARAASSSASLDSRMPRPLVTASAIFDANSRIARSASSLPGMT